MLNLSLTRLKMAMLCALATPVGMIQAADNSCHIADDSQIIYVNAAAGGRNDGSSWQNAYRQIEDALSQAAATDASEQIWLAAGEYSPVGGSYLLPANVSLYGGFAGHEKKLKKRKIGKNLTKLTANGHSGHILFADSAEKLLISGVTISGGQLSEADFNDSRSVHNNVSGAALLAYDSQVTLCESKFVNNQSRQFGGAVYLEGGKLAVFNSKFKHNRVVRGDSEVHDDLTEADTDGGAIAVNDADSVTIVNSVFRRNAAGDDGGAIAIRRANVAIVDSKFINNKAMGAILSTALPSATDDFITGFGGALAVHNEYPGQMSGDHSRQVSIEGSTFKGNRSSIAGAALIMGAPGSETLIRNSYFSDNGGDGVTLVSPGSNEDGIRYGNGAGAVCLVGTRAGDRHTDSTGAFVRPLHHVRVVNTDFVDNEAAYSGALTFISLDAEVVDSQFKHNLGRSRAGALWNQNFFGLFDQFAGLTPEFGTVTINDSFFYDNKTLGLLETMQAKIFKGVASDKEQTYGGGAISNDLAGQMVINGSTFMDNVAENGDGGAIHNGTTPVVFYGNLGAPRTYESSLEVNNSLFINNQVQGDGSGGAIGNGGNRANGELLGADDTDLAESVKGSNSTVKRSLFIDNSSVVVGGAIANFNGSILNASDNVFAHNKAAQGGALASIGRVQNNAELNSQGNLLIGNQAEQDEGIYSVYSVDNVDGVSVGAVSVGAVQDEQGQ